MCAEKQKSGEKNRLYFKNYLGTESSKYSQICYFMPNKCSENRLQDKTRATGIKIYSVLCFNLFN